MQPITLQALTSFDWFLIALIAFSTIAAFVRGIIKVLFSLGGVIVGIILAAQFYPALAERLHKYITSFPAAQIAAFALILIVTIVVFTIAARLVRRTVKLVGLGFLDRLLGAAFGFLRGILLGVAALMILAAFLPNSSWPRDSRLAPWFLSASHSLSFLVPQHFQDRVAAGANHLLQQTPDLFHPHTSTNP